jgi:hypothetical protein
MYHDSRDLERVIELENLWKRHWMLVIIALLATVWFLFYFASVLRAYSQSHCDHPTGAPAPLSLRTELA